MNYWCYIIFKNRYDDTCSTPVYFATEKEAIELAKEKQEAFIIHDLNGKVIRKGHFMGYPDEED